MRFHPAISIFLGFLVFLLIFPIDIYLVMNKLAPILIVLILLILSFIFSGFIATYFARERNIKYSLYELIFVFIVLLFLNQLFSGLLAILFIPLGGVLGKKIDGNKNLWDYSYNSVVLTIIGVISTFIIYIGAVIVSLSIFHPTISTNFDMTLLATAGLIVISIIGGFISTFIAEEKKIKYGIYVGIVLIIITFLINFFEFVKGHPNPYFLNPLITLSFVPVYLLAPTIGSYLAIKFNDYQKKANNKIDF